MTKPQFNISALQEDHNKELVSTLCKGKREDRLHARLVVFNSMYFLHQQMPFNEQGM